MPTEPIVPYPYHVGWRLLRRRETRDTTMKAFGTLLFTIGTLMIFGTIALAGIHSAVTTCVHACELGSVVRSPLVLPITFAIACSAVGARMAGIGRHIR